MFQWPGQSPMLAACRFLPHSAPTWMKTLENHCEYQNPYKANYRRLVKNKHSNYKAPTILQVGAECGKKLQAANIGLCPGIETLRPLSYSSVGKLSKF